MKIIAALFAFLVSSCTNGKEKNYTGSTPADPVVRMFLGIPLTDSVDFIRWKLQLEDNQYLLQCNYGIGKPNTNGFYNGGKKIELKGRLVKEQHYYRLFADNHVLDIAELNEGLLHIAASNKDLLTGNGGWSYTLNNTNAPITDAISLPGIPTPIEDSIVFEGRTPCGVPGIIEKGKECYKLKWLLVLYNNSTYKLRGTAWQLGEIKTGNWKIITGDGRVIYQLLDKDLNQFIQLLKPPGNILLFIDKDEKLLIGNEDFSYTLNKKL